MEDWLGMDEDIEIIINEDDMVVFSVRGIIIKIDYYDELLFVVGEGSFELASSIDTIYPISNIYPLPYFYEEWLELKEEILINFS